MHGLLAPWWGAFSRRHDEQLYRVVGSFSSRLFGPRIANSTPQTRNMQPILTPTLLHSFRSHPRLPKNAWYYVTGVTLSALNRPDEVPAILTYALETGSNTASSNRISADEQLYIARRMREGLLKSAAIVGMPKV